MALPARATQAYRAAIDATPWVDMLLVRPTVCMSSNVDPREVVHRGAPAP